MQPRLFGLGDIIHVARMLTNTLVVLLRQWCWCSKHIPVKHPPRAMGQRAAEPDGSTHSQQLATSLCRADWELLSSQFRRLVGFNYLFSRNISKAIFFF